MLFFLGITFISVEAVLPLFLKRLGAPNIAIAALPVAMVLGINLPSIFVAAHVESLDRKLPYVLRVGVWQRLPWTIVGAMVPFFAVNDPWIVIWAILVAVFVTMIAAGFTIPGFFDILTATVPVERRGTLGALRSMLSYLAGIGGGVIVQLVLEHVAYPFSYTVLFGIATLSLFAGLWTMSRVREPERRNATPSNRSIGQRIRYVLGSSASFRWYVVMRGILAISFATTGFFPVYLADRFGLTDAAAGLFSVITAVTFVIVNPVFGRVGNRIGYKSLFVVSFLSLVIAALLGLLAVPVPLAYLLIALAAVSRAVNLLSFNMTVEFSPPGRVPSFIGVAGFFIGLVAPLGLLLGTVVDLFGYSALFLVTVVTATAGLVVLVFRVSEPRRAGPRLNRPNVPG